jgi:DNA modification methylase
MAITQPGDLWIIGDHRLICGDCTNPATIARLMDGASATVLVTSPPYDQQRTYCVFRRKSARYSDLMSATDSDLMSAIPI